MSNMMVAIVGLLIIGFSFMFFTSALPTISTNLQTGNHSVFENSSTTVKSAITNAVSPFSQVMPFMLLILGFAVFAKGVLG
jgi:hypothetical protein